MKRFTVKYRFESDKPITTEVYAHDVEGVPATIRSKARNEKKMLHIIECKVSGGYHVG